MARTRYLIKKSLAETLALFVDAQPRLARAAEIVPVDASLQRTPAATVFARRASAAPSARNSPTWRSCGLGVHSAANALGLDFIPVEREDYDLVFRRDFYESPAGQALHSAMRSEGFRTAVSALGGNDVSRSGTVKLGSDAAPQR